MFQFTNKAVKTSLVANLLIKNNNNNKTTICKAQ